MALYRLSPAWRITPVGEDYELHGGDDARYLLEASTVARRLSAGEGITRDEVPAVEIGEFEQLRSAGVIGPVLETRSGTVALLGDPVPVKIGRHLVLERREVAGADLVVVVRHRSTHREILEQVRELERVHLYADISFHHTVSIGPLVIPHETPCIGCLYGRLQERWGDHRPAPQPAVVTEFGQLVSALLSTEVGRVLAGDTALVGRTIAWDLEQRRVVSERLLTVPICSYCQDFENQGVIPS
ncbi:MAG: TOMM precursor leader peptide-binding protein [Arachnia propionica]|uniref:TOMM precursor leader peptide-binding protein n=1 Tax=Arachnia propionica TaxID=1750 RepID=UPI0027107165|nr:TOMM precursor leader peptide-binding protein [Arachnia propionica]